MIDIEEIFIHCADTPDGSSRYTVADIDKWHGERGFRRSENACAQWFPSRPHIGYHYVIETSGIVRHGRHESETGAHAEGHNAKSLGVCLIGRSKFTEAQWASLAELIQALVHRHGGPRVRGHREVNPDKDCPGFDAARWFKLGLKPMEDHVYGKNEAA